MYLFFRYLYSLMFGLSLPFVFLRLYIRSFKVPAYRGRWLERLAIYKGKIPQRAIWVHAVSVGEVVAALPLIKELLKTKPEIPLIVTTTTVTGSARLLQENLSISHFLMPYDLPMLMNKVIAKYKPRLLVIMETELWPNLLAGCSKFNVPVVIANGRISDKSFSRYLFFKKITNKMLSQVGTVCCQSELDGQRFLDLGLAANKLVIAGNLKFEINICQKQDYNKSRPTVIAASTHSGEEVIVLDAWKEVLKQIPNALLILVPRHPQRFAEVAKIIENYNFSYVQRSKKQEADKDAQVVFGDTMGELNYLYSLSDLAFVGGSLVPIGGHNLLEPAAYGLPVLTGPHMANFKKIAKLMFDAKAAREVTDANELATNIINILSDNALMVDLGLKAQQVVTDNQGAKNRHIEVIEKYL